MSDTNTQRTASVLILNNHRLLLLLRDNKEGVPSPNTWCLIGGFINDKETEEEAARREAKEEAGINLDKLHYIGTHEYANGRTSTTYLTVITDSEVNNLKLGDEGQETKFFSFEDLAAIPLSGSIKRYYNNYQDQLKVIMEIEQPILIK